MSDTPNKPAPEPSQDKKDTLRDEAKRMSLRKQPKERSPPSGVSEATHSQTAIVSSATGERRRALFCCEALPSRSTVQEPRLQAIVRVRLSRWVATD